MGLLSVKRFFSNSLGDKFLVTSHQFNQGDCIIYSLHSQCLLASQEIENDFVKVAWRIDFNYGEVLLNCDSEEGIIYVYSLDSQRRKFDVVSKILLSTFFDNLTPEEIGLTEFKVAPGKALIVLACQHYVLIIDPFTGSIVQEFQSKCLSFVKDIEINWCSNEIIILHKEALYEKHFIEVFPFQGECADSLFNLSLKSVLLNYSVNDLATMNLPKAIKNHFIA